MGIPTVVVTISISVRPPPSPEASPPVRRSVSSPPAEPVELGEERRILTKNKLKKLLLIFQKLKYMSTPFLRAMKTEIQTFILWNKKKKKNFLIGKKKKKKKKKKS